MPDLLVITQPVVNVYLRPEEETEVNTQAMYGSSVDVIERQNNWCKIRTADREEGWVQADVLIDNPSYTSDPNLRPTKSLYAHIYRIDNTIPFPPLLTLPFDAPVKLQKGHDPTARWIPIELVSGKKAWIQRGDIDFDPLKKKLEEIIPFALQFKGLPYTWGGATSFGFDCSGFIQMLFKQMGYTIPRNARAQIEWEGFSSVKRHELLPCDVLFFGEGAITHVGLSLGHGEFLHAGVRDAAPVIGISNLKSTKYTFAAARQLHSISV